MHLYSYNEHTKDSCITATHVVYCSTRIQHCPNVSSCPQWLGDSRYNHYNDFVDIFFRTLSRKFWSAKNFGPGDQNF